MASEVQQEVLVPLGLVRAVSLGYPQGTGGPGAFGVLSNVVVLQAAWSPLQYHALAVPQLYTLSSWAWFCRGTKGDVWDQKVQERPCTAANKANKAAGFEGARGKADIQVLRLLSGNSQLCRVRNGHHPLQWTTLVC